MKKNNLLEYHPSFVSFIFLHFSLSLSLSLSLFHDKGMYFGFVLFHQCDIKKT